MLDNVHVRKRNNKTELTATDGKITCYGLYVPVR